MRSDVQRALEVLQSGRPDQTGQALSVLQDTVFSFSMKVCGHRQDAEDTMQETLLKAVAHLKKFSNPKALGVWLYKVAKNHCLMNRRKSVFAPKELLSLEELMPAPGTLHAASPGPSPERRLLLSESSERLQLAVRKLPPEYRMVLVMHDMEELSTEEIAKALGIRPGTVRVRLHRARVFVRNELARDGARRATRRPRHKPDSRCKRLFAMLSEYIDHELPASQCDRIEKHMSGCHPCETFLNSLEDTVRRLRQTRGATADPRTKAELRARVLQEYERVFGAPAH